MLSRLRFARSMLWTGRAAATATRSLRAVSTGTSSNAFERVESYYGENIFDDNAQKKMLPKEVFEEIKNSRNNGKHVSKEALNVFASTLKTWALERGVTHFTHMFMPLTGLPACKHETMIGFENGRAITQFKASSLTMGEPDASSFPSGGMRATHTAKGHTVFDPHSPCFVLEHGNGKTMYVPSVFVTLDGQAQDLKLPLLRSTRALQDELSRVFRVLGDDKHTRFHADSGGEQEFFLLHRDHTEMRPDLRMLGRTVCGAAPPKGQERDDQYFHVPKEHMLDVINDMEMEAFRLGIPIICRHGEVAPSQMEIAPRFAPADVASDGNVALNLLMEQVARRHNMTVLLHEKPFHGVNGSAKHNNWSIGSNAMPSFFNPGKEPSKNLVFNLFTAIVIKAAHIHGDVFRLAIAGAGNDNRLGGYEAPPSIVSVFLGAALEGALADFAKGSSSSKPHSQVMDLGTPGLPEVSFGLTERNRTSPFACSGNRFEYRAVGSSQPLHISNTYLNTMTAAVAREVAADLESRISKGAKPEEAARAVVGDILEKHSAVVFAGNNYSEEWRAEAARRGLFNLPNTVDALEHMCTPKNRELFGSTKVLSATELEARQEIGYEQFSAVVQSEAKMLTHMARTIALPAAVGYLAQVSNTSALGGKLNQLVEDTFAAANNMEELVNKACSIDDAHDQARAFAAEVRPYAEELRALVDAIETHVSDEAWGIPTYADMLFQ